MNLSIEVIAGAIGASFLVSFTSLSGVFALWVEPERLKRIIPYLVALAVGVLLGDAFIHLIPDAVARQGSISNVCLTALLGMFLFFVLEKLVRWRHDHHINLPGQQDDIRPIAKMNLMGDAVHNFVDGILIGGSFIVDPVLGFTTTMAIIAHEIPQEIGDVGALVYGGYAPTKAVLYSFYCSLTVVVWAVFTLMSSQLAESSLVFLLPIAAGGFIYIALTSMKVIMCLTYCTTIPPISDQSDIRRIPMAETRSTSGFCTHSAIALPLATVICTKKLTPWLDSNIRANTVISSSNRRAKCTTS